VLKILGLEDCFERIISFGTLNSTDSINPLNDKDGSEIFHFCKYRRRPDSDMVHPKTLVIYKPFEDPFEKAFESANIDSQRTVRAHIFPLLID